ncbi:DUF2130 domain-containing protein [Mycoplasmoides alvi]|uniref:DUF2130 domain-containing protein n=1 Tax=Mycoplasmoides alvi TaxID=78580 RepID=UPI00051C65E4|nr:DUF2130 domain-containing protein [Mycoplasmoides alvi]
MQDTTLYILIALVVLVVIIGISIIVVWIFQYRKKKSINLNSYNNQCNKCNELKIQCDKFQEENKTLHLDNAISKETIAGKTEYISKLEDEKAKLNTDKDELMKQVYSDKHIIEELKSTNQDLQNKIKSLDLQLEDAKEKAHTRDLLNVKQLGEDLEKWSENEYRKYFQWSEDTIYDKTTKGSSYPDFSFRVFNCKTSDLKNLSEEDMNRMTLGHCILEMKTEANTSINKKKNKDHLKDVENDRKKLNADTAVLVTELEREKTIHIDKADYYENIYIIRPQMLIAFLGLYRLAVLSNRDIREKLNNYQLQNKSRHEIDNIFETLKSNLIEKNEYINARCDEITGAIDTIKKNLDTIENKSNVIKGHSKYLKRKIEDFDIKKPLNELESLEQKDVSNYSYSLNNIEVNNIESTIANNL